MLWQPPCYTVIINLSCSITAKVKPDMCHRVNSLGVIINFNNMPLSLKNICQPNQNSNLDLGRVASGIRLSLSKRFSMSNMRISSRIVSSKRPEMWQIAARGQTQHRIWCAFFDKPAALMNYARKTPTNQYFRSTLLLGYVGHGGSEVPRWKIWNRHKTFHRAAKALTRARIR